MTKRIILILFLFAAVGAAVVELRCALCGPDGRAKQVTTPPMPRRLQPLTRGTRLLKRSKQIAANQLGSMCVWNATGAQTLHRAPLVLATQVAEIAKYNVHTCQDYMDLAAMIERGEMVTIPALTDSYVPATRE